MQTALGFLSILFWSTTVAFSRSLTEQLGVFAAATAIYLPSGVLGVAYQMLRGNSPRKMLDLPRPYLLGCGSLFVTYMLALYLAIGLASSRQQVIEVGVINYLWPGLTLLFSIPILKKKAGVFLIPGILVAFSGVFLAMTQGASVSWKGFVQNLSTGFVAYVWALVAAVSWGLYSNLSRRWAGHVEGGGVPVFLLASGLLLLALHWVFPEESRWTRGAVLEVLYMSVVASLLAYAFWDIAMRKGNIILVASFSYLTPLLSTAVSCLYLQVVPGWTLWLACALVVGGALICKVSVKDRVVAQET